MNGNKAHVHFDPAALRGDPDSGRSSAGSAAAMGFAPAQAPAPAPAPAQAATAPNAQARTSVVRKIQRQTVGEGFEDTSLRALQAFAAAVDSYCATSESLASLGKSLYSSASLVLVVDELARVILWNDAAVALCGYAREEMAGRALVQDVPYLVPPPTAAILADAHARCVQGVPVPAVLIELVARDQRRLTLLCACSPLVGNPVGKGMLVVAQDLSQLPLAIVDQGKAASAVAETPAIFDQNQGTRTLRISFESCKVVTGHGAHVNLQPRTPRPRTSFPWAKDKCQWAPCRTKPDQSCKLQSQRLLRCPCLS